MSTDLTLQFQYTEAEYVAAVRSFYNHKFHIPTYAAGVGIVLLAGFLFWLYSREPVILFGWSVFALIVLTWENRQFYLLFYGERLFTVIPKRVFADAAQEAQFRELLQRKISPHFFEF